MYTDGISTKARLGFNPEIAQEIKSSYLFGDDGCKNANVVMQNETEFCIFGAETKSSFDFILVGDSHARHLQPLLNEISLELGLRGLFAGISGCPALIGVYPDRGQPHPNYQSRKCYNINKNALELAKNLSIKNVILASRWDYYVDGSESGSLNRISDDQLALSGRNESRKVYNNAVNNTVRSYDTTEARLLVLLQVPHQEISAKRIVENLMMASTKEMKQSVLEQAMLSFVSLEQHFRRQRVANDSWLTLAKDYRYKKLVLVDPTPAFCENDTCPILNEKTTFYVDSDHASRSGMLRLKDEFTSILTEQNSE
jgi:hypothetical protein